MPFGYISNADHEAAMRKLREQNEQALSQLKIAYQRLFEEFQQSTRAMLQNTLAQQQVVVDGVPITLDAVTKLVMAFISQSQYSSVTPAAIAEHISDSVYDDIRIEEVEGQVSKLVAEQVKTDLMNGDLFETIARLFLEEYVDDDEFLSAVGSAVGRVLLDAYNKVQESQQLMEDGDNES
jgi:hypothetical protein